MPSKDHVSIGPAPAGELAAWPGQRDYEYWAMQDCIRFIALIRRVLGPEPDHARLRVMRMAHGFGSTYDVVCHYDREWPESMEYALAVEANAPIVWDARIVVGGWKTLSQEAVP